MDETKSCPMAFFTPIVEIAEAQPNISARTKEDESKSNEVVIKKEEDEILKEIKEECENRNDLPHNTNDEVVKQEINEDSEINVTKDKEPKFDTKDEKPVVNKRKRGRPKKTAPVESAVPPRKSSRVKKTKEEQVDQEPERVKKPRKQRTPKKKSPELDQFEVKLEEDDFFISPDHIDENKVIKCPICKDDNEWNLKEIKEHYKKEHPGKRLRTSRFFGDLHPCDICGKEFKSASSLKDHIETHNSYYYCDICNHSTKKILDHILHLRVHHHMGLFQCLMCEFNTMDITKMNDHVNHHEDLLKYWCDSCKKSFQILQHFQEHDNYHTGLKPFDCEFCGKCFLYSRYLHAHKINMHREEMNCPSTYECVICNKVYQHRNSLKLHMNSHTGNFAICDICGKTLSSKEKLKFHLRTHTGYKPYRPNDISYIVEPESEEILIHFVEDDSDTTENVVVVKTEPKIEDGDENYIQLIEDRDLIRIQKDFQKEVTDSSEHNCNKSEKKKCNVCGSSFKFLGRHLETHGPHNCLDCLLNFSTQDLFDDHRAEVHDEIDKNYSCDICSMGFSSLIHLAVHKFKHTKQYTCPVCNFTVKGRYRNSLMNHIRRHEGKFSVKCEICGQGFVEKSFYMAHREMHEAIPKYECEFCHKKFTVKRYLEVHKSFNHKKEMYGIEEIYQCEVCGVCFTFEKSLVRHLSCIHKIGADRTVVCSVCHKKIANNHNLKKHMRTHTGEKKFCCDFCGKAFSEKKYFKRHQAVHKKERLGEDAEEDGLNGIVGDDEDSHFIELYNSKQRIEDGKQYYFEDVDDNSCIYFTVDE